MKPYCFQLARSWNNSYLSVWPFMPCENIEDCPGINLQFLFEKVACCVGCLGSESLFEIAYLLKIGENRSIKVACNTSEEYRSEVVFSLQTDLEVVSLTVESDSIQFSLQSDHDSWKSLGKAIESWSELWAKKLTDTQ